VLEPGARSRAVTLPLLPDGGGWRDFHSGRWHPAGQTAVVDAPLERIPLFLPAGGILPLGKAMRHIGQQPDDLRQVHVAPHRKQGRGRFTLVEDDGLSLAYRRGEYSEVLLEVEAEPDSVTLSARLQHNGYPLAYRTVEFILPPNEMRPLKTDGACKTWLDSTERRHVQIVVS